MTHTLNLDLKEYAASSDMKLIHKKNHPETSLTQVLGILLNDMLDENLEDPESHMNARNNLQAYQTIGCNNLLDVKKRFKLDYMFQGDLINSNIQRKQNYN